MSPRLLAGRAPAKLIDGFVALLVAARISPMAVTLAGLAGSVVAAVLVARGELVAGGIVLLVASALDMFDGALARATGRASRLGALVDSTADRLSEGAVLFGLLVYETGLGNREEALLVFAVATGSMLVSYLRARAEGEGLTLTAGLFTRPERIVVLSAALISGWLRVGLWALAVLTLLTAAQRLFLAVRALREDGR
ncbi:MAG: CDP-alcohol phosphatidyltransferase family protein [Dehalococcoidia bacterium]